MTSGVMFRFLFGRSVTVADARVFAKMVWAYLLVNLFGRKRIQYVEIMTSYACNAKCNLCSNTRLTRYPDSSLLTKDKIHELIKEIASMGVPIITWLGGEPLLDRNIFTYVKWTRQEGMLPIINSNGQLLDRDKIHRLRDSGLHSLFVTIYSTDPEVNERVTGIKEYLHTAVANLEMAKALGLKACLKSVISKYHFESGELYRLIELAESRQVPISFNAIVPTGAAHDNYSEDLLTASMREELDQICSDHSCVTTHFTSNYFGYGCPAGKAYLGVTPYGDVVPCYFCPISYGNVWRDRLKSIYQRVVNTPLFAEAYPGCFLAFSKRHVDSLLAPCLHDPDTNRPLPMRLEDHPAYDPETDTLLIT